MGGVRLLISRLQPHHLFTKKANRHFSLPSLYFVSLSRNTNPNQFRPSFLFDFRFTAMDPTQATRSSQPAVYDAVLLAELTQKLGSVEKAKEFYALFSASLMTSAAVLPTPTIPADLTAQRAVPHEERPQDSTRVPDSGSQQAETASLEADKEEATNELPTDGGRNDGETEMEAE